MLNYSELKKYIGHEYQVFGAKSYQYEEGKATGLHAVNVKSGGGLEFEVLKSCGLDIGEFKYKGVNLAFLSKTGPVNSTYFVEDGSKGFLRGFYAGMLTTCGLTYMGAACEDEGQELGAHGMIHNTPAEECRVSVNRESDVPVIEVAGRVKEAELFGMNLVLERSIRCSYGENKIRIRDKVRNEGFEAKPLMILYHCNMGYPLIDENTVCDIPHKNMNPRDEESVRKLDLVKYGEEPEPSMIENCYFYENICNEDGWVECACINEKLGLKLILRYEQDTLQYFSQWKSMKCGDYAIGFEPGNNLPLGRAEVRKNGTLEMLQAGEEREFLLEIEVVEI